jgi:hypothetical protein
MHPRQGSRRVGGAEEVPAVAGDVLEDDDSAVGLGAGLAEELDPGGLLNWAGIVDLDPKPPILWTHGAADVLVADGSMWEAGTLGAAGHLPGWPGIDVFPPQPMVTQLRDVLGRYAAAGGSVRTEIFEGSGHGPMFDGTERWKATFFGFLESVA